MRTHRIEGIIIKRRNYGETDRFITVFTKYQGKIQIKAKGVRKIISRRSPHVELLNHSVMSVYQGKGMPFLTEAVTIADHSEIKNDLAKVGFAYHLCELVDGLCPDHQENYQIFSLLQRTLKHLCEENDIATTIHAFEISLLTHLGFFRHTSVSPYFNTTSFIEQILERKLKSRQILHLFR